MCVNEWSGPISVPQYIADQNLGVWCPWTGSPSLPNNTLFVPYFNSSTLLGYMNNFIQAMAAKYDGDPRINWIDIGFYGHWGEGHMYELCLPVASVSVRESIVNMMVSAFKNTRLLINDGEFDEVLAYALTNPQMLDLWD